MAPERIIQSWDTGNKAGPNSAYSCCITALVRGNDIYILHVLSSTLYDFDQVQVQKMLLSATWLRA